MTIPSQFIPMVALVPVLIATAVFDLRELRIPNALPLASVVIFLATLAFVPLSEAGLRVVAASICFALLFGGFCMRLIGGGDVKMLSALMLFVPSESLVKFAYIFSGSLLAGVVFTILIQQVGQPVTGNWASRTSKGKFPMGLSIALSGFLCLGIGIL